MSSASSSESFSELDKFAIFNIFALGSPTGCADLRVCFPAFSWYKVERPYTRAEFQTAIAHYFKDNPVFHHCELQERQLPGTAKDFTPEHFQEIIEAEYPRYRTSFLLISVTFQKEPQVQGIFSVFPIPLVDGYTACRFQQALFATLLDGGRDHFKNAEWQRACNVHFESFVDKIAPKMVHTPAEVKATRLHISEKVEDVKKIDVLLPEALAVMKEQQRQVLIQVFNVSSRYEQAPLFGNYLSFPLLDPGMIAASGGNGKIMAEQFQKVKEEGRHALDKLNSIADIGKAGGEFAQRMFSPSAPPSYMINNYGNTKSFNPGGRLIGFRWHMPLMVLGLPKFKALWTITVADRAFNYNLNGVTQLDKAAVPAQTDEKPEIKAGK